MKKVIFVLFMLISSLCLFSCANTKESTSSTQESTINNQIKPDSIDYEDGKIFVSGVKDGTDSVKIYVGDRLVNNYDKSCVRNGVLEASYSIAYSSKDKGPVTIKAIAIKGDTTSEITNTVDFLEKVDTESVKFGQYYISFDEVENAQKYIIEFTEKDSINMVVNTSKMESETSFIEFEQSLNNKFDRYNNLYISIQPYATNYVSYPISQKYTRTPNVSNLSYSNSKITFTSGYDRHHIVITENGNTIDEIIDKDYYDYAPQGHNFSVSVSAYELEKELPAVNLNMKAIKNLDGFSFGEDKIVFENDDETATYTYKLYKDENVFKSAVKAQSITFKDYYYQILGENLRLEITRNIDTTKEYLVGETEFKLYCLNDFYISDSMLDSDVVGNKKTYGIKNSCEDSSVNVSVYKGDNLLDSKKYDYSSSTQNYEFNYEKDSTYKVVFERILSVEDGYIINLDRIHDKYEITHDIPTNVEAVSLEDASNDQIKITSEELDSKTDDCALYLDSTKLKDTYTYNNSFTISNSNFSDAKTYDLYLVSKYYTETEPVSIKGIFNNKLLY